MPNSRRADKKNLTVWLVGEEKDAFDELARVSGKTMSQLLTEMIRERIKASKDQKEGGVK